MGGEGIPPSLLWLQLQVGVNCLWLGELTGGTAVLFGEVIDAETREEIPLGQVVVW